MLRGNLPYLGVALEIMGIIMALPAIIAGMAGDGYAGFIVAALMSFAVGTILDKRFSREHLTTGSIIILSSMVLVSASLVGSVPYMPYMNPLDAMFESVSGFTATGLTTVRPESLPASLLFWRALTQWIGGLGVVIFFVLMLPSLGVSSFHVHAEEDRKIGKTMHQRLRRITVIYATYTLAGAALFGMAGMGMLDAVTHSFTSISAGGFSTRSDSLASFGWPAWIVAFVMMALGSTSFVIHDEVWRSRLRSLAGSPEFRLFWAIALASAGLMALGGAASHASLFHAVSALSTCGLSISPLGAGSAGVLPWLMLIGGFAGSAAGGVKLMRLLASVKGVYWLGKRTMLPKEAVVPLKVGKTFIKDDEMLNIMLFVFAYLAFIGISVAVISSTGYDLSLAFFQAASAQGTVGLSVLDVGAMPALAKLALMMNMLLGRLEIFPVLALLLAVVGIKR